MNKQQADALELVRRVAVEGSIVPVMDVLVERIDGSTFPEVFCEMAAKDQEEFMRNVERICAYWKKLREYRCIGHDYSFT